MQYGLYIYASVRIKEITAKEVRFLPVHRKHHLERLCKLAYEMNLEVITKNVDFDTYKNFDLSRRTIKNHSNTTLELLEIKENENWSKNFKMCQLYRKLQGHDITVQIVSLG